MKTIYIKIVWLFII